MLAFLSLGLVTPRIGVKGLQGIHLSLMGGSYRLLGKGPPLVGELFFGSLVAPVGDPFVFVPHGGGFDRIYGHKEVLRGPLV